MSQLTTATEEIEEHRFEVYMMPPREAFSLLLAFKTALAPVISEVASAKGEEANLDIASLLPNLVANLDDKTLERAIKLCTKYTTVDGHPLAGQFDVLFLGRQFFMLKWLGFALKSQYSDFF